jgi:group II intron reverse transcriptase/maturase
VRFRSLAHLLTPDILRKAYWDLNRKAAAGIDGVTWTQYQEGLSTRLDDLHGRLRNADYKAQPVRRTYIPKGDGKMRPLGVTALEDKIVQKAVVMILEHIYEADFHPFSYGFRPGKSPQQALDAVRVMVTRGHVNWILEADIKGYFDNVVKPLLMEILNQRIGDGRLLDVIGKWLHCGVIDQGELLLTDPDRGTPQGAVISPLLGNIYLHHVLDEWVLRVVAPRLDGAVHLVRYADDFVMGFEYRADAERVLRVLHKRMDRYGLTLHPDKTRIVRFGNGMEHEPRRSPEDSRSFDFLGFTHTWARNHRSGYGLHLRTMAKRLRRSIRAVHDWCQTHRHLPVRQQWKQLQVKLVGHYGYYGRRTNYKSLQRFLQAVERCWRYWLNRRSQRTTMPWEKFHHLVQRYPLPSPRIRTVPDPQLLLPL